MNRCCPKCGKEISDGCIVCPSCGFDLINGTMYSKEEINKNEAEIASTPLSTTYKILAFIIAILGFIIGILAGNTYPVINENGEAAFNILISLFIWLLTFLAWLGVYSMGKFLENQQTIINLLKQVNDMGFPRVPADKSGTSSSDTIK